MANRTQYLARFRSADFVMDGAPLHNKSETDSNAGKYHLR